jgi:hypothetical protein
MILLDVPAKVLSGLTIGLPAALATSKFAGSHLHVIKPNDPLASRAVAAMLAVALLEGYASAQRASRKAAGPVLK